MYSVESFRFNTASQAADCFINNRDWHNLCEIGISEQEYSQAVWCLRNFVKNLIEQMEELDCFYYDGIEIAKNENEEE